MDTSTRTAPAPTPTPAAVAALVPRREAFDRHGWEARVMASDLHRNTRTVAFVLAHHGGDAGHLPSGGPQSAARLAHLARITPKQARLSLQQLEVRHFIARPPIGEWPPTSVVRPVTLTIPPARTEPAHCAEAVS